MVYIGMDISVSGFDPPAISRSFQETARNRYMIPANRYFPLLLQGRLKISVQASTRSSIHPFTQESRIPSTVGSVAQISLKLMQVRELCEESNAMSHVCAMSGPTAQSLPVSDPTILI